MKMKCLLLLLLCVELNYYGVYAATDHDIKRGTHTYMAFIYCTDPSVLDISGERLVRSAVLIRPEWLITTAIGPSLMDPTEFPKKTLLARTGAITIDSKFTLNEDEDEQEREIVQIVRPYKHSATQWWTTDISLMKTLIPFNMTSAVSSKSLTLAKQPDDVDIKTCSILVYTKKFRNSTEDKSMMLLYVELLPPSIDNCGSHFTADTMACAADSDENKDVVYDPEFCQGNSGGPIICNNDVIGLQTYIGNNCVQPHLYQLLNPWNDFIKCAIQDKCQEEQCVGTCDIIYKDPPKSEEKVTPPVTYDTAQDIIAFINVPSTAIIEKITTESIVISTTPIPITTTEEVVTFSELVTESFKPISIPDLITLKKTERTIPDTTSDTMEVSLYVITEPTEKLTIPDQTSQRSTTEHTSTTLSNVKEEIEFVNVTTESVIMSIPKEIHWPKERLTDNKQRDDEEVQRKTEVEAQHAPEESKQIQNITEVPITNSTTLDTPSKLRDIKYDDSANMNLSVLITVLIGLITLLCL